MLADSPPSTSSMSRKSSPSKSDAPIENTTVKSFSVIRRGQSSPSRPPLAPQSEAPERPADTLKVVVGDKGRRSRCAPEFLHEVATAKYVQHDLLQDLGRKFKIIAGKEAVGFYKRFLKRKEPSPDKATQEPPPQVVFAVTVTDTGRKLVDYYLTWRGKTRATELRGSKRKVDFLDSEFRKVARTLDKEFKRASVYGSVTSVAGSSHSSRKAIELPENPKPRPPTVVIPPPGEKPEPSPDVPQPRSATDSVTSLPVLSYIRGVPFGNRMPLTVMNPDRLSTISSDSVQTLLAEKIAPRDKLASVTEEAPTAPSPAPSPLVTFSPPGRTDTLSSRSTTPQSEASTEAPSLTNAYSHSNPKPDFKSHSEVSSEFLIVCLDEMIDKNGPTWHGLERQTSRSSTRSLPTRISPWDGPLARANGVTYRTPPIRRVSSVKAKIWAADGSSSSSSEEEWENEPVIPFEPFIVPALPSEAPPSRVSSPASMNMGVQYGPGAMPILSSSYASPMVSVRSLNVGYPSAPTYGSPYAQAQANHLPSSPYVSPYVSPNMPLHRSLSQSTYSGYSPYVS